MRVPVRFRSIRAYDRRHGSLEPAQVTVILRIVVRVSPGQNVRSDGSPVRTLLDVVWIPRRYSTRMPVERVTRTVVTVPKADEHWAVRRSEPRFRFAPTVTDHGSPYQLPPSTARIGPGAGLGPLQDRSRATTSSMWSVTIPMSLPYMTNDVWSLTSAICCSVETKIPAGIPLVAAASKTRPMASR